jgi:hypothetical protein
MEDSGIAICAILAIAICLLQAKRIDGLERDVRSLADGDAETVKLRRKLAGQAGQSDG